MKKKFTKSFISLMCTAAIVLSCFFTASAAMDDVMFDLTSLGVLDGFEVGDMNSNVTRAEFSKLVVNALGYSDLANSKKDSGFFTDISSSPYKGEINLLYDMKIVSGTGFNQFSPDSLITYPQIGKIMVSVLGYSNIIKTNDLTAYMMQANILGVYKGVDVSKGNVTVSDALIIIHNCLDIDIMSKDYGMIGDTYKVVDGKTLKSSLSLTAGKNIVKYKGVVTADAATYLYQPYSNMRSKSIEINGKLYSCQNEAPVGLVGMSVYFYLDITDSADGVITSIAPTEKNDVVKIYTEDLISVSGDSVRYYSDDSELKLTCAAGAKIIYNDRWNKNASLATLSSYQNGYIRFIDNDDDGIYDIVFVNEFKDALVERIYSEAKQVYFANSVVIDNARYAMLDPDNDDGVYVILKNANGEDMAFEDIKEDNVISVAKSLDGGVITAYISDKKVSGNITAIEDDEITIGRAESYKYVTRPDSNVGDYVDAYINFMNKIVYTDKVKSESNYAYVYATESKGNLSSNAKVSLLLPGHVSETKTDSYDEDGASETTKKLFFRNDAEVIFELDSKVNVDGTKYSASETLGRISGKIVTYDVNSAGKINKIETLQPVDNDIYKTYNESGKTFSKGSTYGFGIDDKDTLSICIPLNSGAADDDLLVPVKLLNSTKYQIQAYDVDEDTSIASLVVIKETMISGMPGVVTDSSDVAAVKKVTTKYNEKDETIYVVDLVTKDGDKSYAVSNLIPNPDAFSSLKKGDLIAFQTVEGTDELNGFSIIQSVDSYNGNYLYNAFQSNEMCLGTVSDCKYCFVSKLKNRWADAVTVNYGTGSSVYEIFRTGGPAIFLLDEKNNPKLATFDDIQIGDRLFVSARIGTVRALVIKR